MLTDSHSQLEKILNNNTSGLKSELEMKEQNYNELLKELEIKDLHIKSLEKLLGEHNPVDIYSNIITKDNTNSNKNENFNVTFSNKFKQSESSFEKDDEREKELNQLVNKFNVDTENKIQPEAIFSNNFELKYDKDMNEELRNLAKQTKEMDNNDNNHIHTDNNIVLNQSLRNQILNNKSINTNASILTGRSNGNKTIGKIFFSKK